MSTYMKIRNVPGECCDRVRWKSRCISMEQNKKIGYKDIFKQKEYMKMMVAALINRFGDSITQSLSHGSYMN